MENQLPDGRVWNGLAYVHNEPRKGCTCDSCASYFAEAILREFMADVQAVGVKHVGHEWPDLLVTYNKARIYFEQNGG